MTAAVLYGKEDIKIEKVPIPRVADGEVLVKVQVALTCGTDLKVYQRGYHARMIVPQRFLVTNLPGSWKRRALTYAASKRACEWWL